MFRLFEATSKERDGDQYLTNNNIVQARHAYTTAHEKYTLGGDTDGANRTADLMRYTGGAVEQIQR